MTPDLAPVSGTRRFVLAVLVCGMAARTLDANPHPTAAYVPFVVAAYVLPLWYASGRARGWWLSRPGALLGVQAVITYVPFLLFGDEWVGGVSGLLGGLALLLLRGRAAWGAFALLALLEEALWRVVGMPPQAPLTAAVWVVVAYLNSGMTLFGLNRLVDLMDDLRRAREVLAGDEVARLRLTAMSRLQAEIQGRLEQMRAGLGTALKGESVETLQASLLRAGREVRQASAAARHLSYELPEDSVVDGQPPTSSIAPRLARAVTAVVVVAFGAQYLVNVADPTVSTRPSAFESLVAVVVAAAVVALQLRHVHFGDPVRRPRGWPWTLGAQGALALVTYPFAGPRVILLLTMAVASALVLIRHGSRWVLLGAMVAAVPVTSFVADVGSTTSHVLWSGYAALTAVAACLLVYGLARFTQASVALEQAGRRHAEAAATRERLRLARDTHDTLGLGLSTVALKTDLAVALLGRDASRARHEAAQALHLASVVASDVSSVASGQVSLDLSREVATAELGLRAAGVDQVTRPDGVLSTTLDDPTGTTLAAVLREATTNVLRHSRASTCSITLERAAGQVVLQVTNDGVTPTGATEPGQGLDNMAARLRELDGSLQTRLDEGRFTLTATLPEAVPA